MKIITWNCCGAFRRKSDLILAQLPDILIIPECEAIEKLNTAGWPVLPTSSEYLSYQKNIDGKLVAGKKGLAVFSFADYRLDLQETYSDAFEIVMPLIVTKGRTKFNLFAVWTLDTANGHYVEQIWNAVKHYDASILKKRTILIGDFNSNVIWDKPSREWSHGKLVAKLVTKGIRSVYHEKHGQLQGEERDATFFLYRHEDKPYHIDHCFVSKDLLKKLASVEVGSFKEWREYSDHVPMIVTFS